LSLTYLPEGVFALNEVMVTASALDPDRAGHLGRTMVQYLRHLHAEAAQNFAQLAAVYNDPAIRAELSFLHATNLLFDGQYEAAMAAYEKAATYPTLYVSAHNNLGIAAMNKAMELAYFENAEKDKYLPYVQTANESFSQALASADDDTLKAQILATRGSMAYRFSEDLVQVQTDCEEAIALAQSQPIGYVCRGATNYAVLWKTWLQNDCHPPVDAQPIRAALSRARLLSPREPHFLYWTGMIAQLQSYCDTDAKEQERHEQECLDNMIEYIALMEQAPFLLATDRQLLILARRTVEVHCR
jgi:tetratricopeptide (TPR) repeat protein